MNRRQMLLAALGLPLVPVKSDLSVDDDTYEMHECFSPLPSTTCTLYDTAYVGEFRFVGYSVEECAERYTLTTRCKKREQP